MGASRSNPFLARKSLEKNILRGSKALPAGALAAEPKDLGMHDLGQDFERLGKARPRSVAILIAVDQVDVVRGGAQARPLGAGQQWSKLAAGAGDVEAAGQDEDDFGVGGDERFPVQPRSMPAGFAEKVPSS